MPWCNAKVQFEVKMFFKTIVLNMQDHIQRNLFFLHSDFPCDEQD